MTQNKTYTVQEAKKLAISGMRITHPYFLDDEYIYFSDGKYYTEENIEVPFHYWIALVPEMQINWSEYIKAQLQS